MRRLHSDRGALEQALKNAGAVFKGKTIGCLWHQDDHPSGSIYQNDKGEWRYKCHACGVVKDVIDVRALSNGKSVEELLKESDEPRTPAPRIFPTIESMLDSAAALWKVEDCYRYTNPDTGNVDMVVIRCRDNAGKKSFIQARPEAGGYVQKAPPKPWPIFNRTAVRAADTVIVVEGEKCVKALRAAGWTATTSPAGAMNADKADWAPLAGKKVILWRDFDENGQKYIDAVAAALGRLTPPPQVLLVSVEDHGLPEKSDCVDYLSQFGFSNREDEYRAVAEVVADAVVTGPSAKVTKLVADTISGKRYAAPWPAEWRDLSRLTHALLPGSSIAVCGDPAASKSFWILQAARAWHKMGVQFAMYELEADEDGSHLLRAIAQIEGNTRMLDWEWVRDHPADASAIEQKHRAFIDSFGARLWTPPANLPHLTDLTDWVNDRAKEGCRVIAIDPITAADTGKQRWDDDRHFVINTQKILRDNGASMVLVTHPKLSNKSNGLADVGGGAAYTRFTQTVIWIKAHDYKNTLTENGQVTVNRTIKISKARHAKGTGHSIAYKFGAGMTFEEFGTVIKEE